MTLSRFLDPKNDIAFKKVFGSEQHKNILIHFLNDIIELKDNNQIEDVVFLPATQAPEVAINKETMVDILCRDKNGVHIIVEMQVNKTEGFQKRAIYYAAKTYVNQLSRGSEDDGRYINLNKVIFISINNHILFPEKAAYKSTHFLLDNETHERDLKELAFIFIELPKFKKKKVTELTNILEKWCFFFRYAKTTESEDFKIITNREPAIEQAYEALSEFNWSKEELLVYEAELKRTRDKIAALDYKFMEGMQEGIEKGKAEGMQEGIEKGKAEGIQEGIEIARREARLTMIKKLLAANHSVEYIADFAECEIEEVLAIRDNN